AGVASRTRSRLAESAARDRLLAAPPLPQLQARDSSVQTPPLLPTKAHQALQRRSPRIFRRSHADEQCHEFSMMLDPQPAWVERCSSWRNVTSSRQTCNFQIRVESGGKPVARACPPNYTRNLPRLYQGKNGATGTNRRTPPRHRQAPFATGEQGWKRTADGLLPTVLAKACLLGPAIWPSPVRSDERELVSFAIRGG